MALLFFKSGFVVQALIGVVVAAYGVNKWGFYENSKIDQELRARTSKEGELIGFVFRNPPTALDAHAEVGLLNIEPNKLEITTETDTYVIPKDQVIDILTQLNIHSLLGLGGWIVLSLTNEKPFSFESRKHPNMRHSRIRSKKLIQELRTWKQEKAPR